jgi:hypothetical protein
LRRSSVAIVERSFAVDTVEQLPLFERNLFARRAVSQWRYGLIAHSRRSGERRRLEEFVKREFAIHFGARVKHFMPLLLGLHDSTGGVRAVVGCRSAAEAPLFLETYTRMPIESTLETLGVDAARDEIVEIGGLACRDARAAVDIVGALIPYLLEAGFSWVVFTGADTVKSVFRRMRLVPMVLCRADPALLGPERNDWGSYYDHHPEVMAGRLCDGRAALRAAAFAQ